MMKKTLILGFAMAAGVGAFALLAQAGSAPAQAVEHDPQFGTEAIETFVAVDEIQVRSHQLLIRGLPQGGSSVVERTYYLLFSDAVNQGFAQRCERLALLMLTQPGAYQLDVDASEYDPVTLVLDGCTLRRNE